MKGYALADPSLPGKMWQDIETRRDQRHELAGLKIRLVDRAFRYGQTCSAFVALAGFAAAIVNQWLTGATWVSVTLAAVGVSPGVGAAITGKKKSAGDGAEPS